MSYQSLQGLLPKSLKDYVVHFEAAIEREVVRFAQTLPQQARLLDAGAGECQYAHCFSKQRYTAVDLAIGDQAWNYARLHAIADLTALPFADNAFEAAINIVTLEHVKEPAAALAEIARVLAPGGQLLLVAPHEWEVHQFPHDYFRYTRYGLEYLLQKSGFTAVSIQPVGGYFRLMQRRLLNGLQFFPQPWFWIAALFIAPPALLLPLFDGLDRQQNFTLGYVCLAKK